MNIDDTFMAFSIAVAVVVAVITVMAKWMKTFAVFLFGISSRPNARHAEQDFFGQFSF